MTLAPFFAARLSYWHVASGAAEGKHARLVFLLSGFSSHDLGRCCTSGCMEDAMLKVVLITSYQWSGEVLPKYKFSTPEHSKKDV